MRSTGFWPSDANKQALAQMQTQIAADAVEDNWEHFTGWSPFKARNVATTRYFSEVDTRGYLDFDGGAVEIISFSINGSEQILNQQFLPMPENALDKRKPYRGLQLGYGRYYGGSSTLMRPYAVTARWGYSDVIPGDVWQACQQLAALMVLTQIENLQGIASISQDGFSKAYDVTGTITALSLATGTGGASGIWGNTFLSAVERYKREVF